MSLQKKQAEIYVGQTALDVNINNHCVSWSGLWENQRKRVPDSTYHRDHQLESEDDAGELFFTDGSTVAVDHVLFDEDTTLLVANFCFRI